MMTRAEFLSLLRSDFHSFCQAMFGVLHPGAQFRPNWHLELIADRLQAVVEGRIKRLIINLPPRSLKSELASVFLPAWWLGRMPGTEIICASYAQDLAEAHARHCRTVLLSPRYREIFGYHVDFARQAVHELITQANGRRFATSVGGVLTGRGADAIIIDDPLKPDEALSETQRRAVNDWFNHTLLSRLNNKETGSIIVIMQRLHQDDLAGHLAATGGWDVLALPAIAEQDERFRIQGVFGTGYVGRTTGEALHPIRESLTTLEMIRHSIGPYNFAGQYQQSPTPLDGGMIKRAWFQTYTPDQLPTRFDRIVQSWDTANKPSELNDYSVCTTWGISSNRYWLRHVQRKRLNYPDLKRAVVGHAREFAADIVLIEDRGSGTQLIQDLLNDGLGWVQRYEPRGDKIMRMHAQTAPIENGFVLLPAHAHWLEDYLHEMTIFPKGSYDDQVDSTAQFLEWARRGLEEPGIIGYYRMLNEQNLRP